MLLDEKQEDKAEEEKDILMDDLKISIFPNPNEKKKKMTTTFQSG